MLFINSRDFNPRSPHGERLHASHPKSVSVKFQSTLPARGATYCKKMLDNYKPFQSTLPARGATGSQHIWSSLSAFQSTLPARGATGTSDLAIATGQFQSTLPARGATSAPAAPKADADISIHAPRTGSDRIQRRFAAHVPKFQSTLPARGATRPQR